MNEKTSLIQPEPIEQVILLIRGQRVMLDRDLAALYGVETENLNKAVRRNLDRFPPDFMFQLTADEAKALSFQFGSLKRGQHFTYLPQVSGAILLHQLKLEHIHKGSIWQNPTQS
jgi:hypothetical protein